MAVDAARAKSLFLTASDLTDPAERAAYLERECGGDAELRARVEALLAADGGGAPVLGDGLTAAYELTSPPTLEATAASRRGNTSAVGTGDSGRQIGRRGLHARRRPAGRSPRRIRRGPGHRRPVHAARSPRRGGNGHRLPGRSDSTGQAAGGAQTDQDRHGLARGAGAVRRRAAGAGPDGPPQHRPRVRRRQHRGRPAVLRDGAGERGADHRVLRPPAAPGPGPPGVVRGGLPGGAARPPEGDHPPRSQAQQCDGHRGGRTAHSQSHRLRGRQGDRIQPHRPEPRRHRSDRRHADVHVARAGRPVVDGHRHPDRRLRAGRDPLRAAGRVDRRSTPSSSSGGRSWRCCGWCGRSTRPGRAPR